MAELFQKLLKALFFCPAPKMKEAPSIEGAFLVSATPAIGKAPGAGYVKGIGIVSGSVKIYRVTVSRYRWPFQKVTSVF